MIFIFKEWSSTPNKRINELGRELSELENRIDQMLHKGTIINVFFLLIIYHSIIYN